MAYLLTDVGCSAFGDVCTSFFPHPLFSLLKWWGSSSLHKLAVNRAIGAHPAHDTPSSNHPAQERGLPVTGRKVDLIARLKNTMP
jgi:hypothetical protein